MAPNMADERTALERLFSLVQPGDRVRVDFEDGALEGSYEWEGTRGYPLIRFAGYPALSIFGCADRITGVRVLAPAEPPYGSVVLDLDGDAWQRRSGDLWYSAEFPHGETWRTVASFGPLTILHRAQE